MEKVRILFREAELYGNVKRMLIVEGIAEQSASSLANELSRGKSVRIDNHAITDFEKETPSTFYFNVRVILCPYGDYVLISIT